MGSFVCLCISMKVDDELHQIIWKKIWKSNELCNICALMKSIDNL